MRTIVTCILFAILLLPECIAQKIDNLVSFRDIKSDNYIRFNYENDLFAGTDANYTQGYSLEVVAPFFKKNPLNYLLYAPPNAEIRYGLAIEHLAYTPERYELPDIQFGDRPFAAAIMLRSFSIASHTETKSRITASLSMGIIGPAAFGDEIQTAIHKITGDKIPLGWHNQIKNDLVLTYQIGYEKQLFNYKDVFTLEATTNATFGTLFTNAAVGIHTTFGIINNPFSPMEDKKDLKLYVYAQPVLTAVGYDATLQGGVFNKNSPYTISSGAIERFTGQVTYGIVLQTTWLYLEYSQTAITREFETGRSARWGGVKVGVGF